MFVKQMNSLMRLYRAKQRKGLNVNAYVSRLCVYVLVVFSLETELRIYWLSKMTIKWFLLAAHNSEQWSKHFYGQIFCAHQTNTKKYCTNKSPTGTLFALWESTTSLNQRLSRRYCMPLIALISRQHWVRNEIDLAPGNF